MTAVTAPAQYPIRAAALSDRGRVRQENQDSYLAAPERGLFVVADGLGGHQAGATASQLVVELLPDLIMHRPLAEAVVDLSGQVHATAASRPEWQGMGATLVLALLLDRAAHVLHLGDSRAYLLRQDDLSQLTGDHTLAAALMRAGEIDAEEARTHFGRHQLTRYVGMEGDVLPEVRTVALATGDRLLLCSDGLYGMVPHAEIARLLREHPEPVAACRALVAAANAAGGRDNITVVVVDVGAAP